MTNHPQTEQKTRIVRICISTTVILFGVLLIGSSIVTTYFGAMRWLETTPFMGNLRNPDGTKVTLEGCGLMAVGVGLFIASLLCFFIGVKARHLTKARIYRYDNQQD